MSTRTQRYLPLPVLLAVVLAGAAPMGAAGADLSRIKDLAYLEGTTDEPLVGYGLVVGLNGTGDSPSAENTSNSIATMLEALDVTVDPADLKAKNVAAVIVTAELDPNLSVGARIDVKVNSLNDASSLEGGHLVMTPCTPSTAPSACWPRVRCPSAASTSRAAPTTASGRTTPRRAWSPTAAP